MKKYIVALIAVVMLVASALPACAESVFNDMSKCVQNWGKECKPCASKSAVAGTATKAPRMKVTNPLGNTTPLVTDNSGKVEIAK